LSSTLNLTQWEALSNLVRPWTNTGYASRTTVVLSLRVTGVCVCVCVCARACVCVRACVCLCVCRGMVCVVRMCHRYCGKKCLGDLAVTSCFRFIFSRVQDFPNSSAVKSPQALEQN